MRLIALFWIMGPALLAAQTIPVNGVLTVHNSAYRTGKSIHVRDAAVRALQAKPVTSDAEGRFVLEVVGLGLGTGVQLSVEHDKWVLLDPDQVKNVVLGAAEPLVIRMADPKELAAERIKYHGIAEASIEARYKERMARLRDSTVALQMRLDEMREEFGGDSVDLADAITKLVDERQQALDGVDEITERFVKVDLDGASERFRRAFEEFAAGRMGHALRLLDQIELEREHATAVEQLAQGEALVAKANASIVDLRQCYALKADLLEAALRPKEAHTVRLGELALVEKEQEVFPPGELARALVRIAVLENELHLHAIARQHLEHALADHWMRAPAARSDLLAALRGLGKWHFEVGQLDSVLAVQHRIVPIAAKMDPPDRKELTGVCIMTGRILRMRGEYGSALQQFDSAMHFLPDHGEDRDILLATITDDLAAVCNGQKRLPEAVRLFRHSIALHLARKHPDLPAVALAQAQLSGCYFELEKPDSALFFARAGLMTLRRAYGADHPAVYYAEASTGMALKAVGESDSALKYMDHCIDGMVRWYPDGHPYLPTYLHNRAAILSELGRSEEAIASLRQVLGLECGPSKKERIQRAWVRSSVGSLFIQLNAPDSARLYLDDSLDSIRSIHGTNRHQDAIAPVGNLAAVLLDLDELDTAITYLRLAIELKFMVYGPQYPHLLPGTILLAEGYRKLGLADSSGHYLRRAERLVKEQRDTRPARRSWLLYEQALYQAWFGDAKVAVLLADSSWQLRKDAVPEDRWEEEAILGLCLLMVQREEEAVPHLLATVKAQPPTSIRSKIRYQNAYSLLGGALLLSGRTDTARIVIEEAVRLNGDADALWYEYLLKKDERSANENVDALLRCWKVRSKDYNSSPAQKRTTWNELLALSTSAGRAGELNGLEPSSRP
ncbi:MAG: tetratricopeptide repeat protein [Flavobacteriales bacterium]|nr:tetratricopeptide repeat protein [Flavobacteriales bacterium]